MYKLRYYRHRIGYTKKEVAKATSISISMLKSYENVYREVFDFKHLEILSQFYKVDLDNICDDYNFFIQTNQAEFVRNFRKANKLTQRELGKILGGDRALVQRYESKCSRVKKEHFELLRNT